MDDLIVADDPYLTPKNIGSKTVAKIGRAAKICGFFAMLVFMVSLLSSLYLLNQEYLQLIPVTFGLTNVSVAGVFITPPMLMGATLTVSVVSFFAAGYSFGFMGKRK